MKKIMTAILVFTMAIMVTGCTDTESTNEEGKKTREFNISETATVNNTKFKINSVKKVEKECNWEYDGKCQSWTEPDNDYFLLVDVTIENTGNEDLDISSIMSFELKDFDGNKGNYALLLTSIKSQLDGTVMSGDKLTGQIGYDVKEADEYNFYFNDSLLDSPIKFLINSSDIQ